MYKTIDLPEAVSRSMCDDFGARGVTIIIGQWTSNSEKMMSI